MFEPETRPTPHPAQTVLPFTREQQTAAVAMAIERLRPALSSSKLRGLRALLEAVMTAPRNERDELAIESIAARLDVSVRTAGTLLKAAEALSLVIIERRTASGVPTSCASTSTGCDWPLVTPRSADRPRPVTTPLRSHSRKLPAAPRPTRTSKPATWSTYPPRPSFTLPHPPIAIRKICRTFGKIFLSFGKICRTAARGPTVL
ncbi:MAG: hypothetical protein QM775_16575 [Pirellulales bacterium]